MNKFISKTLITLVSFSLVMVTAYADSKTELSNRMSLDLDVSGQLTINNNYLSNMVIRGVSPGTGEEAGMMLVKPSSQAVDFDLVDVNWNDVNWDGYFPVDVELKAPVDKREQTEIDLSQYDLSGFSNNTTWQNIDLQIRGGGLFNAAESSIGQGWNNKSRDAFVATALDALTLVEIFGSTVESLKGASLDGSKNGISEDALDKINKVIDWASEGQERLEDLTLWAEFSSLLLNQMQVFIENGNEVGIDLNSSPYVQEFYRMHQNVIGAVDATAKALGSVAGVSGLSDNTIKQELSKEFEDYYKKISVTAQQQVTGKVIDAAAKEFAQAYQAAGNEEDKYKLLAKYVIEPADNVLQAYRKVLLKRLKAESKTTAKAKKLERSIKAIDYGHGLAQFVQIFFAADDIVDAAKKDPQVAVSLLTSIGKTIFNSLVTADNVEALAQGYIEKNAENISSANNNILLYTSNNASSYMAAVSVGSNIGNRLIPFLWDIVFGPDFLSTSIVDGQFSQFGQVETAVSIYRNGELLTTASNLQGEHNPTIEVEDADLLTVVVGLKRPKLFDDERSPWLVNSNYSPNTLYDVLIQIPNKRYRREILCVTNPWGVFPPLTYAHHSKAGVSPEIYSDRCGVTGSYNFSEGGFNKWYGEQDGFGQRAVYSENELPEWLKLKTAYSTLSDLPKSVISYSNYTVETDDRFIQVLVDAMDAQQITHKINFTFAGTLDVSAGNDLFTYLGLNDVPELSLPTPVIDQGDIAKITWKEGENTICEKTSAESCSIKVEDFSPGEHEFEVTVLGTNGLSGKDKIKVTIYDEKVDIDGDDIADVWEINHGIATYDPSIGISHQDNKNTDADGDKVSDFLEFIENTDPQDENSFVVYEKISGLKYVNGRIILTIGVDPLSIPEQATDHKITLNFYDSSFTGGVKGNRYDWGFSSLQSIYEIDVSDFVSTIDKAVPFQINLSYSSADTNSVQSFKQVYGIFDRNEQQLKSTIAARYLEETIQGKFSISGDNVFDNAKGNETKHTLTTVTHRITDLDKVVNNLTEIPSEWKSSQYATSSQHDDQNDTRQPLLLIHGWQGSLGQTSPSALLSHNNSEFEYWHNFLAYYLTTPELNDKFKVYLYHYPSYKHITYNARILGSMLSELKANNDTSLGKALNNQGIVIQGHSMGGLVARSMIEEHKGLGENAEKLIKLITLDTPHHGSMSAIQAHVLPDLGDGLAKDLETPGAVDLHWDNYDRHYNCVDDAASVSCMLLMESNNGNDEDSRKVRLNEIDQVGQFDNSYLGAIDSLNYLNSAYSDENKLNPFLLYLNTKFELEHSALAQQKYLFYVAHTAVLSDSGSPLTSLNDPKVSNPIRTLTGMYANTEFIRLQGYAAGGAQPVASAFLSSSRDVDNTTRYYSLFNDPFQYVVIDDDGDENNYSIPYRYFWDYNHEYIFNGVYKNKGGWDKYIDQSKLMQVNANVDNNFTSATVTGDTVKIESLRNYYIDNITRYINTGLNNLTVSDATLSPTTFNPLRTEPVFLMLGHDLLTAVGGFTANAGEDKTIYETQVVELDIPTINNSTITATSYVWDIDGEEVCSSTEPEPCVISGLEASIHVVNLTVTSSDGNTATDDVLVTVLTVDTDTDEDLMPDIWEEQYGLDINADDASADADKDGVSNYQEYVDGTDPTDENSILSLSTPVNVVATVDGTDLILTWDEVTNATVYSFCLAEESISNIHDCTSYSGGRFIGAVYNQHTVSDLDTGKTYYIRVMALDNTGHKSPQSEQITASLVAEPTIIRVSVDDQGNDLPLGSKYVSMSDDGRYIAYQTGFGLVNSGYGGESFIYDATTGTREKITLVVPGGDIDENCHSPEISGNGRYVACESTHSFHPEDVLNSNFITTQPAVFLYDRETKTTVLVSRLLDIPASAPKISDDGKYLVYLTESSVSGASNGEAILALYNRATAETHLFEHMTSSSINIRNYLGTIPSYSISGDGKTIAFKAKISPISGSFDRTLLDNPYTDEEVILMWSLPGSATEWSAATVATADLKHAYNHEGVKPNGASDNLHMSDDGRYVVFESSATNLIDHTTTVSRYRSDVYRYDTQTGVTELVYLATSDDRGDRAPVLSADGKYTVFRGTTSVLDGDIPAYNKILLRYDNTSKEVTAITKVKVGEDIYFADGYKPAISADGSKIAFYSGSSYFVDDDQNGDDDVFLWNMSSQLNLNSGLIAHYEFEDNANDSSVNDNHGTENGGVAYVDGVVGKAASFDGINDYIRVPDNPNINFSANQDFSISVWVLPDEIQPDTNYWDNDILTKWNDREESYPYVLRYLNQNHTTLENVQLDKQSFYATQFQINQTPTTHLIHSNIASLTKYTHIVVNKANGNLYLYQDSILVDSIESPFIQTLNTADLTIAARGSLRNFFKGNIDDLRIYNRSLTSKEIIQLQTMGINTTATGKLNDTGITTCSDDTTINLPCPVDEFP